MSPLRVTFSLVAVVIVIIGAYYATYYVGLKASGQSRGRLRNRNINLIDRFAISRDKGFYLVEISGKVYVIGVTNQSMTLIDTYDAAAFSEAAALSHEAANTGAAWGRSFTSRRADGTPGAAYQYSGRDGGLKNDLTNRLAAFIAARVGRPYGPVNETENEQAKASGSNSFGDSMAKAQENQQVAATGGSAHTSEELSDDSERNQ